MPRPRAAAILTSICLALGAAAATADRATLDAANIAWEEGDYPAALTAYLALIDGPHAAAVHDEIALRTGELFVTTELTRDGGAPQFAPDGRYLTYETGHGVGRRLRVARAGAPGQTIAELPGHGAVFSPDGARLAYLSLVATPGMLDLEAAIATATGTKRTELVQSLSVLTGAAARITIRDLDTGTEHVIDTGPIRKNGVRLASDGLVLFTGTDDEGPDQVYLTDGTEPPRRLTSGDGAKVLHTINSRGTSAVFLRRPPARKPGEAPDAPRFGVVTLPAGTVTTVLGSAPAYSSDGDELAYVHEDDRRFHLMLGRADAPAAATPVRSGAEPIDAPAFSPDGLRLAFQLMPLDDWDVFVAGRDGRDEIRVTREAHHDVRPRFLADGRLLALSGEARHRRAHVYDPAGGTRARLFHNNTVRTIAPEYEWSPHPDGTKILIVADRDGDTVSPERGVYLTDLTSKVTQEELRARLRAALAAEQGLRAGSARRFGPIAGQVASLAAQISTARIYGHAKALVGFDSKHISRPGNQRAAAYLFETYRSFGYAAELQAFPVKDAAGGETANVVARLEGTRHPEVVYVVSSHFDSVAAGPGADDNSSGTSALLELARVLAKHPLPATVVFASLTGEESGLLGSREFVRRAKESGLRIAGMINNDTIGWSGDARLDSTVRHSNPGIRDAQHAAALGFTSLITYDARYYRSTDAHPFVEAYGDIAGGFGAYPVLASPHYHRRHDVLEHVDHRLVAETAKATLATVVLLASSPSPVRGLEVATDASGLTTVRWETSPEKDVDGYVVSWTPAGGATGAQTLRVTAPAATIRAPRGAAIAVRAVNERGLESWDSRSHEGTK